MKSKLISPIERCTDLTVWSVTCYLSVKSNVSISSVHSQAVSIELVTSLFSFSFFFFSVSMSSDNEACCSESDSTASVRTRSQKARSSNGTVEYFSIPMPSRRDVTKKLVPKDWNSKPAVRVEEIKQSKS